MHLHAEHPFHGAVLLIIIDQDRNDLAIEDMNDGVSLRDDVNLIPLRILDDLGQFLVVADGGNDLAFAAFDGASHLSPQRHKLSATFFIVISGMPYVASVLLFTVDIELVSLHGELRLGKLAAAIVDPAVAAIADAIFNLELKILELAAAPDDEGVLLNLISRSDLTNERAILGAPVFWIAFPAGECLAIEDGLKPGRVVRCRPGLGLLLRRAVEGQYHNRQEPDDK